MYQHTYVCHYQKLGTGLLKYAIENVPEFLTMLCVWKTINRLITCLFVFSLCFETKWTVQKVQIIETKISCNWIHCTGTVPVHRNYVCLKQKIKFLFDKRENKCGSKQQNIINDLKDVLCTKTVCNHEMWWIRLQEIWILEMWPHNNNVPQAWQISALKLTGVILPK